MRIPNIISLECNSDEYLKIKSGKINFLFIPEKIDCFEGDFIEALPSDCTDGSLPTVIGKIKSIETSNKTSSIVSGVKLISFAPYSTLNYSEKLLFVLVQRGVVSGGSNALKP